MRKTRTFIGVHAEGDLLSGAVRALEELSALAEDVKWVEPENLHWTLHFLGEIDDDEIHQTCRAVQRAAARHTPFLLTGLGLGAFPSAARPRTLWLGAGEGSAAMIALQASLDEELAPMGFRGERRQFVPHLTLGRVGRRGAGPQLAAKLSSCAEYSGGVMPVEEVTIYASRLQRQGPEYQVLAQTPLGD